MNSLPESVPGTTALGDDTVFGGVIPASKAVGKSMLKLSSEFPKNSSSTLFLTPEVISKS